MNKIKTQKNLPIFTIENVKDSSLKEKGLFPEARTAFKVGETLILGIPALSQRMLKDHKLSSLDLSEKCIGPAGIHQLASAICECIWIKELNLSGNKLTDEAGKIIAFIIKNNDSLISLSISHNQLEETGSQYIGKALGSNIGIETLDLSWNHIRLKGAVTLCNGFLENRYIHTLNLSSNGFAYEGAVALSRVLKCNKVLKEIDLSDNRICWRGALVISKGLRFNKTLEILKLRRNPLTTTGCMYLLEAISTDGNALQMLDIQGMPVVIEFVYLSIAIQNQRNFSCLHGFIVTSHDYLGRKKACIINPMDAVIGYMRRTGLRPMELMRCFDKQNKSTISRRDFAGRLKKCEVQLHGFEVDQLTYEIQNQSPEEERGITFEKLLRSVSERRKSIRREKSAAINQKRSLKVYHENILNPVTPKDDPEKVLMQGSWDRKLPTIPVGGLSSQLVHGSSIRLSTATKTKTKKRNKKQPKKLKKKKRVQDK